MKPITRREALLSLSTASAGLFLSRSHAAPSDATSRRTRMGIVTYAFGIHQKNEWAGRHRGLSPALALLEETHRLGAAGIQVDLGPKDAPHAAELRRRAEQYGMYVEAGVSPPRNSDDVNQFEQNIRLAKEAGATLARTVILPGRRYEQFKSFEEFREFEKRGLQSLQLAEPVLARHQFHLAVENHKDQRIPEKLETIKSLNSEWVGICVDVGNSFTLMEDPLETVTAFAPFALTVHFKDQAVRENPDGFSFADVALGEGFLDLPALVKVLFEAKPGLHLNLETITRDPLNVPILKNEFWATLLDTPARDLARTLRVVKTKSSPNAFPVVSQLSVDQQLALELRNVQQSLTYARDHLALV
jgi:sugar phosphate isomerase/epimerase